MKSLIFATAILCILTITECSNASLFFATDFDGGTPGEFSGVTTVESVGGYGGVGWGSSVFGGQMLRNQTGNPFAASPQPNQTTRLTLQGLASHSSISMNFLFAAIDSWDGFSGNDFGPEFFNVTIDGQTIFSQTFSNFTAAHQTYAGQALMPRANVGFSNWADSAYFMSFDRIAHSSSELTIEWFVSGVAPAWEGGDNESWGIDNLNLYLNVPEPSSIAVWALGFLAIGLRRNRRHVTRSGFRPNQRLSQAH